jgi:hypothetical protein
MPVYRDHGACIWVAPWLLLERTRGSAQRGLKPGSAMCMQCGPMALTLILRPSSGGGDGCICDCCHRDDMSQRKSQAHSTALLIEQRPGFSPWSLRLWTASSPNEFSAFAWIILLLAFCALIASLTALGSSYLRDLHTSQHIPCLHSLSPPPWASQLWSITPTPE